ncbi:MAG: N-acetylmuramoyl-L-alanine amidase [Clostridia bacterium]|nr:N-acetylmuramoyl-L-alanine amidase [Clostridia bacterium]
MCPKSKSADLPAYLVFCFIFTLVMLGGIALSLFIHRGTTPAQNSEPFSPSVVVVLDAGHGGEDCGAIGKNGIYEKDLNLSITEKIRDVLRTCGINTVMTRSEDILLYDKNSNYHGQKKVQDLMTRKNIAEAYNNAIFVSIHMNAFPQEKYSGLQVWYSTNSEESQPLAALIQEGSRVRLLPENKRSVKAAGENIYLLHQLQCPAVLVECGFLSNADECARLSSKDYQKQMALSIALSILEYCADDTETSQNKLDFSENVLYNKTVPPKVNVKIGGNHERRENSLYLFFL